MSAAGDLRLRAAEPFDAVVVHAWANDAQTRAASFLTATIPLADHLRWFERQVDEPEHHLVIVEEGASGEAVAFVRLDARGHASGECTISINVAPQARGRGLGTAALEAASAHAQGLGVGTIHALIRVTNEVSVRVFEKAGYVHRGEARVEGQEALRMVWTREG